MCFLSTISPTDLFEFSKHVLKFMLAGGSIYLILQRFHLRLQMRFLKNISDEIIKINDTCIEFSYKYAHFINDIGNKVSKIEKLKYFKFRDKAYSVIKWILFTGVAPTITLIIGLGKLYNFDPTLIVGTISLFASFLGAITGLSNYNYNKKNFTECDKDKH